MAVGSGGCVVAGVAAGAADGTAVSAAAIADDPSAPAVGVSWAATGVASRAGRAIRTRSGNERLVIVPREYERPGETAADVCEPVPGTASARSQNGKPRGRDPGFSRQESLVARDGFEPPTFGL